MRRPIPHSLLPSVLLPWAVLGSLWPRQLDAGGPTNINLSASKPQPAAFAGASMGDEAITLQSGRWKEQERNPGRWAYVVTPAEYRDCTVSATLVVRELAKQFSFFGQSWSVWPDHAYGDQGFEAAVLLRAGERDGWPGEFGYRVQLSHKYQELALVKYPDGGYLRSVPCEVRLNHPHRVEVTVRGALISVKVDGREKVPLHDTDLPLEKGRITPTSHAVSRSSCWCSTPFGMIESLTTSRPCSFLRF